MRGFFDQRPGWPTGAPWKSATASYARLIRGLGSAMLVAAFCAAQPARGLESSLTHDANSDDPSCRPECRDLRDRVVSCERGALNDALDAMTRLVEVWPGRFRSLISHQNLPAAGNPRHEAAALVDRALRYLERDQYDRAVTAYEQAEVKYQTAGRPLECCRDSHADRRALRPGR